MIRNTPLYIIKTSLEGKPRLEDSKLWDSLVWLHSVGGEEDEAATSDRKIHNLKVRSIASKSTCLSWRSAILPCGGTEFWANRRSIQAAKRWRSETVLHYSRWGGARWASSDPRNSRCWPHETHLQEASRHLLKVAIRKGAKKRVIEAKEVAQQNAFIFGARIIHWTQRLSNQLSTFHGRFPIQLDPPQSRDLFSTCGTRLCCSGDLDSNTHCR